MDVVFQILSPVVAASVTYLFTSMHYRRKTWGEFKLRRLNEFYGPMHGLIKQFILNYKNSIKVKDSSEQAYREIREKYPYPLEGHDKYSESLQKTIDYENERFRNKDISALDKILEIFKSKGHLAYPSTEKLLPQLIEYVDQFHRLLPYEFQKKLNHSAESFAKLSTDVEAHVDKLRHELSGDKRA